MFLPAAVGRQARDDSPAERAMGAALADDDAGGEAAASEFQRNQFGNKDSRAEIVPDQGHAFDHLDRIENGDDGRLANQRWGSTTSTSRPVCGSSV